MSEALRVHVGRVVVDRALMAGMGVGVLRAQLEAAIARGGPAASLGDDAPLTEHIRAAVAARLDRSLARSGRRGIDARP